ncbi:MAG: signal peptidase II [Clostridia bacterium]|nr:signal peptidase II [Clostridia bacterium]
MRSFLKSKWAPLVLALIAVILDQITKALAVAYLKPISTFPIIEGVFHLTYRINYGAAFSMFEDQPWVFMTVSTVAILGILVYYFWDKKLTPAIRYPLCMIVGGGIGNMIDRIFVGYVVDFFDARFINFAVFNVADCFVTVGAFLLFFVILLDTIREERAKKKKGEVADDDSLRS